ncbi:MAG: hypothetical protein ACLP8S_06470, partial [Solirubrobacteraceae bacterium]
TPKESNPPPQLRSAKRKAHLPARRKSTFLELLERRGTVYVRFIRRARIFDGSAFYIVPMVNGVRRSAPAACLAEQRATLARILAGVSGPVRTRAMQAAVATFATERQIVHPQEVVGAGRLSACLARACAVASESGGEGRMNDPFDVLRAELVSAAERAELASSSRRWRWFGGRSRPVAVVIAALVVCGSAAAGVLSLTVRSSAPLSGRLPGTREHGQAPGVLARYRYSIRVTPGLSAGEAGWAVWTAYGAPSGGLGSGGGGGYPTVSYPIFQGSGVAPASIDTDPVGFVLTGPQVAAVRIGDRTIRTFASSMLPAGDRAAVFFSTSGAPQAAIGGWRASIDSHTRRPEPGHPTRWTSIPTVAVLPLNHAGGVLPTLATPPESAAHGWSFWQAPSAVTPSIHEPPCHGPTRPHAGVCELAQHGLPGLTAEWGSTITSITTVPDSLGELFLSCVTTMYYLHGWPITAAVLLDARHPGAAPGPIPGARAIPGDPSVVDFPGASLSARRIANAWLVVQGGSGTIQRLGVLQALRIDKLDLRTLTP